MSETEGQSGAIDFHCHWVPEALAEALRARTEPPMIRVTDGVERIIVYRELLPLLDDLIDMDQRLAFMDANSVDIQVLSFPGLFGVDSLPADEAAPLLDIFNEALAAEIPVRNHRLAGMAALPIADMDLCVQELQKGMTERGFIGAIVPANGFVNRQAAAYFEPLLAEANRLGAHLFIHPGPMPGATGESANEADNAALRHIVLNVQALLSEVTMTVTMTDLLDPYPDLTVQVANLGGTMPFIIERLDHVVERRQPDAPLPSSRMNRIYVDTSSFDTQGIEAAARVFGPERVLFGSDCPIFSTERIQDAMDRLPRSSTEIAMMRRDNGAAILRRFQT